MHTRFAIILNFLLIISLFSSVQAEESIEPEHLLLLNSYNQRMTWVKDIVTAVEDVLKPDNNNIILHIDNMDSKQFHSPEYFNSYKNYLKNKYKNNQFSIIFSSDNHAFDFLRKNRDELFPGVPVVFCGVNNFKDDLIQDSEQFTGVAELFSARNTVEMALKLHPETEEVFIVNDYLTTGRAWEKDIDKALSDMKGKLRIAYAQNLSMDELKTVIANLNKNTIVLLGVYFADKNGKYFTYEKIGAMISGASHVPVYCLLEFNMGKGILGGKVISGYYQGQAMAKIGKRVLKGENPNNIPVLKHGTNRIMFDYLQLKRFSLNESSLPDNSIVINKPFSAFQEYKTEIIIVTLMLSILILTIIALVLNMLLRNRAEKALKNSEKKHRKLVSNISDVIVILDKDGNITYKSPNIIEHFGWNPDELIGKHGLITVHPDDQERVTNELMQVLKRDNAKTIVEYEYLCKDGSFKPVELTAVNLLNDPIISGVLANYKDISHRKEADIEIRKSGERLKAIFNASPDPIVVYNVKGYPEYINEAFTSVFHWHLDELQDRLIPFVPEDQKIITKLKIEEIYKYGTPVRFETKRLSKNGEIIDVLLSAAIIKGIEGIHNGLVVNLKDITERKNLEVQIQQTQKMESIGTLAGGIAHDFNNILFPIVGHSEMLLEDVPKESPFREGLNQIYTGALRASELIKQILTFSRQESGELKLMKMQPIIKEALKLIRATIPTTIEIKHDLQSDCGAVKADPTQIHQIVINLATNAYHAMEDTGGKLNINLKKVELEAPDALNPDIKPGAYASLRISDTGKGMDKELIEKIFDPFFTTKGIGKGTGMGLSVVHGIVKSMNGTINVYSELGKGTEFHIYLPLAEAVKEQQANNIEAPIQGGNEHILLVDDEKAIIGMEQHMLKRLGYKVTSHSSSIEALEAFRASPDRFDMIITDLQMPNMSGDKLSVELTKIRPDIPVLLCTGFSETISEEKAEFLGINGFLLKPIVMKDLSHKIREVLDKK